MKRDWLLAACILAGGLACVKCAQEFDWQQVWIYDVKPWIGWDGKPAAEPVGEELRVQREPVRYGAE
jgi:hypothetical protein